MVLCSSMLSLIPPFDFGSGERGVGGGRHAQSNEVELCTVLRFMNHLLGRSISGTLTVYNSAGRVGVTGFLLNVPDDAV